MENIRKRFGFAKRPPANDNYKLNKFMDMFETGEVLKQSDYFKQSNVVIILCIGAGALAIVVAYIVRLLN